MRQFEHEGRLFGIGFDTLLSESYKVLVNEVTFLSCRGGDRHNRAPGCVAAPIFNNFRVAYMEACK